ncbi:MAG: DNA polymerase III subunit delta [Oscillospiraceae bacterium]|nr:DNA polymerase III subunit delta [Oscillospiraceae bacterium]
MAKEETGAMDILKKELKQDVFRRLYFFHGEEHFLRDHYLQMLHDKLLSGPAQEFNYHRFTQENMDLQQLSDAVEALPMMAPSSMVQVDDCDLSRLTEADRDKLVQILTDIPDYCSVVFVFDTVPFKVDGRQKKLKEAVDRGFAVEFGCQNQRELNNWIRRRFRAHGKDIDDRLCEHLTFLTGGTMTALAGEIEKIAAFSSGDVITPQDVATVVIPVLDAQVFDLTGAIADGDYEKALLKLRTLLQMQEEPIPLLASIGGQLRRLLYARAAMNAGKGEAGVTELLTLPTGRKPHPYVLQKTMTSARRLSDGFCAKAMELCLQADVSLKGGSSDDARTLELLILALAQEVRRG